MRFLEPVDRRERDFLRTLYQLAGGKAKKSIAFADVSTTFGRSDEEADRVCDIWATRGVVEWPSLGHVALTYLGRRRAERLDER